MDAKPIRGAAIQAFAAESSAAVRARLMSSSPARTPLATVQSDDNGSFSIDPKSPLADLIVSVAGRASTLLEIADGQDAGVIVVAPGGRRGVRVVADGKPVENALVASGPLMVRTNAQGEADLPETLLGRPIIVQPGFASSDETFTDVAAERPTIALSKGITVSGKVVAADGSAVEHASVSVDGWPRGETNAAGEFTIEHAPKNWRRIVAVRDSRAGEAPNKGRSVTIRLGPAVTISGVARDPNGKAIPGARVLLRRSNDFNWSETAISDANGAFAFPPVAPDEYTLIATHLSYTFTEATFTASKNMTRSIEGKPFAIVRGLVVNESGAAVPGAVVTFGLRPLSSGGASLSGANGAFTVRANLSSIVPQPVVVIHNDYAAGVSAALNSNASKSPVTITLRRGFPVVVKVLDKARQPVEDAAVSIFMANPDSMLRAPVVCEPALSIACRTTDAAGSAPYRVVEGTYIVTVRGESIATKMLPPQDLTARSSPLTVVVDRGVQVAGRVVYRDGTPVADATVMPKLGVPAAARTNPDGSFELRGVTPGPLTIIVRLPNTSAPAASVDTTAPDNNVTLTLPAPGRIEGRVTDKATGQAITDFSVTAALRDMRSFPGPRAKQFHSDAGTFAIDDAPLGVVAVHVVAPGYAALANDVTVEEGKTASGVEFALERGGRIVGRVTANDQPLSGVAVRLGTADAMTTTTDADGQYTIDSVAAGDRILQFSKSGFIAQHKTVDVAAGKDAHVAIAMVRGRDLTGRVVDANGDAIANARLFIRFGYRPIPGVPPNVFSDSDGQFTFEGLADGHYSITASKAGFVTVNADGDVPSTTPLTITMKTGGTITGHVTGLSDAELANARVFASSASGSAMGQVEAGGVFTVRGVPEGKVNVSAAAGGTGRRSATKVVEVVNGTAPPVDLDFSQGVTITGHVTQNGVPISGGNINFTPKKGSDGGGGGQINNDGSYSVSGLGTGDFVVRLFTYSGSRYETDYSVTGNGAFDIDMKGATLRGRVVDATTGDPVSDANVSAEGPKDSKFTQGTTSGSDGRFTFSAVPDGSITLRASREKYSSGTQTVVVASGNAPDAELRLDRGQEAVIRIIDAPSGNPVNGNATIFSGRKSVGNATPGDDGKMHVWLPPGAYRANVSAPDYVPVTVDLTVPGPEVRASLSRAGRLMIVSKSAGDVQITLAGLPLETGAIGGPKRMVRVQPNVSTFVGGLAPGRYNVDLLNSDRATVKQSYSVDVVAGQTAAVNIE